LFFFLLSYLVFLFLLCFSARVQSASRHLFVILKQGIWIVCTGMWIAVAVSSVLPWLIVAFGSHVFLPQGGGATMSTQVDCYLKMQSEHEILPRHSFLPNLFLSTVPQDGWLTCFALDLLQMH